MKTILGLFATVIMTAVRAVAKVFGLDGVLERFSNRVVKDLEDGADETGRRLDEQKRAQAKADFEKLPEVKQKWQTYLKTRDEQSQEKDDTPPLS